MSFKTRKTFRLEAKAFETGASPAGGHCPDFRFRFCPPNFWPEKTLKFVISARKSLRILAKTFIFGDHLFLAGKNVEICDFGQKKPSNWISAKTFLFFIFWRIPDFH